VNRYVVVLSIVTGIAVLGNGLAITALMLDFHARDSGSTAIAALFAALAVPDIALAGLAGRIADNVPLRKILAAAGTTLTLSCAALAHAAEAAVVVLLVAVMSGLMTIVTPAMLKAVAGATPDALLSRAQARMSMAANAGMLLGPPAAGVLMETADLRTALLVVAATSLALPLSACFLPSAHVAPAGGGKAGLTPGLRAIAAQPTLTRVVAVGLVVVLAMQVTNVAEVFLVKDELHAGSTAFGLITTVLAAGQLAGAWAAGTLLARPAPGRPPRPSAVASSTVATAGTSLVLVSVSTEIGIVYVLTGLIGCALGGFAVARQTMLARLTDERLHGSVFAAHAALVNVSVGVGLLTAGAAENLLGPRAVYAATGLVLLAALVTSLLPARLHRARRLEPRDAPGRVPLDH